MDHMKNAKDLPYLSAIELSSALSKKKISAVELLEASISRIEILDKKINAVVIRDFEQARLSAKAADAALAGGEKKPLLGLPITVKESFNVAGLPTSWGNPLYKNWCPNEDALVISRLKAAGAIIIGKTNVPFMLRDWQTYNDIYGTTNNPWNLNLTPGGSSGGSAAALAAGFTSLELGSDFAGSIRVPAHFCGIFGHKPSVNVVPLRGAGPPTSPPSPHLINDFLAAGPLARTANDLALAFEVLAGPDEIWDGKGYQLSLPSARHNKIEDFRVLVLNSHPLAPTSAAVAQSMDNLTKRLTKLGLNVSLGNSSLPDLAEITRTYVALFAAFVSGNMSIEDYQKVQETTKIFDKNEMGLIACYFRGCSMNYRDWLITTRKRNALREQWRNQYKEFDVILCPVMPTPAFPHDHSEPKQRQINIDGKLFPYSNQYAWVSIATLFGLPATVAPIGLTENDLPIGIQILGDYLEDYTCIKFAELLERELGGFIPPKKD